MSSFIADSPSTGPPSWSSAIHEGDGFTTEELNQALHPPVDENWVPEREYDEREIVDLVPGPGCVMFSGRVANCYDQKNTSKSPHAAKGCLKIIVKDDNGAVTVKS